MVIFEPLCSSYRNVSNLRVRLDLYSGDMSNRALSPAVHVDIALRLNIFIKRPARDACLCMGELPAPPAPAAPPAPHFVFLITL